MDSVAHGNPVKRQQRDLESEFNAIDKNGDGKASLDEFLGRMEAMLAEKLIPLTPDVQDQMKVGFREADANGDGFLSFDEVEALGLNVSGEIN